MGILNWRASKRFLPVDKCPWCSPWYITGLPNGCSPLNQVAAWLNPHLLARPPVGGGYLWMSDSPGSIRERNMRKGAASQPMSAHSLISLQTNPSPVIFPCQVFDQLDSHPEISITKSQCQCAQVFLPGEWKQVGSWSPPTCFIRSPNEPLALHAVESLSAWPVPG